MSYNQETIQVKRKVNTITVTVNGEEYTVSIEPRMLLSDVLRDVIRLTGTHVGCEHGICGACTVVMNGRPVRSCLLFGVQANGSNIQTVEGLAYSEDILHPLQEGFSEKHGLQCGFCTPGMLMTAYHFLQENKNPSREEIREALAGVLCRCTGYQGIVDAVEYAAQKLCEKENSYVNRSQG